MKFSMERMGRYAVLTVAERIEWDDARELDEAVKQLIGQGIYHIAFDLNGVSYICSAGIGALVYDLSAVKKNGGAIYIISSSEYIDYMFQTLKFDMVFNGFIYPSIDDFRSRVVKTSENGA